MKATLQAKFMPRDVYDVIRAGWFKDGTPAFHITKNGETWMKVNVNTASPPPDGYIAVKDYGENEGLLDALVAADLIEEPEGEIPAGQWANLHICKLKKLAEEL